MNFWMVLAAAMGVLYLAAWWWDSSENDVVGRGFVVGVGMIVVLIVLLSAGCSKLRVPGELAATAQLRSAARSVDLNASEDVAGKVADFNQSLATAKWQNAQWWGDPFVPDEWDAVSYIPLNRPIP